MPYIVRLALTAALSATVTSLISLLLPAAQTRLSPTIVGAVLQLAIRIVVDGGILALVFAPLTSFMAWRSRRIEIRYLLPVAASTLAGVVLLVKAIPLYSLAEGSALFAIAASIWSAIDMRSSFRDAFEKERDDAVLIARAEATTKAVKIGIVSAAMAILGPFIIAFIFFALAVVFQV